MRDNVASKPCTVASKALPMSLHCLALHFPSPTLCFSHAGLLSVSQIIVHVHPCTLAFGLCLLCVSCFECASLAWLL